MLQLTVKPLTDPGSATEMLDRLGDLVPNLVAFALAFILLGRYWGAHHTLFASLRAWDAPLLSVNLMYLAFVALLPFPAYLVGEYGTNPMSVIVFAAVMATISALEVVMYSRAHHRHLMHEQMTEASYRLGLLRSAVPVVMFVVTMPLAFVSPLLTMLSWPVLSVAIGIILSRRGDVALPKMAGAGD